MIGAGAIGVFVGLLMLPAALGEHPDTSLLILGACGVSLGSLIASSGIFLKARASDPAAGSNASPGESRSARRVRGGCDVCHGDLPVIHCKVHQVHLCPGCLGRHYDFRSCAYVPSTRQTSGKGGKNAKARGA